MARIKAKIETRNIDGDEYTIGKFMTTEANENLTALLDLLGGSLGKAISGIKNIQAGIDGMDFDMSEIGGAIPALFSRIHERRVIDLIKKFMEQVIHTKSHDPKEEPSGKLSGSSFEMHFQGNQMHLIKVFIAAVEVQYSDFFGGFKGRIAGAGLGTILGKLTSQVGDGSSSDQ